MKKSTKRKVQSGAIIALGLVLILITTKDIVLVCGLIISSIGLDKLQSVRSR